LLRLETYPLAEFWRTTGVSAHRECFVGDNNRQRKFNNMDPAGDYGFERKTYGGTIGTRATDQTLVTDELSNIVTVVPGSNS